MPISIAIAHRECRTTECRIDGSDPNATVSDRVTPAELTIRGPDQMPVANYSDRSASIGSTDAARRAGMIDAAIASSRMKIAESAMTVGSIGST
jgi:hypothetical protein